MQPTVRARLDLGLEGGPALAVTSCGAAVGAALVVRRAIVGPLEMSQIGRAAVAWLLLAAIVAAGTRMRLGDRALSAVPAVVLGTAVLAGELQGVASTVIAGGCLAIGLALITTGSGLGPRGQVVCVGTCGVVSWVLAASAGKTLEPLELGAAMCGLLAALLLGRWGWLVVPLALL